MKQTRMIQSAWILIAGLVLGGLAGAGVSWAQEKAPAPAPAPAPFGTVPANLITAEPPFPVRLYTKAGAPAAPRLADLPLQGSVYRYGITWTFEKPAHVGRFVNGDWYVVGPVTVVGITRPCWAGSTPTRPTPSPPRPPRSWPRAVR